MNSKSNPTISIRKEISHFITHLRWHYQVFILSGGFLLGGYLQHDVYWPLFTGQFLNVHLLLFGGATAYNSYCDQDEGPVGGLKNPPPVPVWTRFAALTLQGLGLIGALASGWNFTLVYAASILLFWLYSSHQFRWKGRPLLSVTAIGLSTSAASVLMGYLASGQSVITGPVWTAAAGVSLMLVSLYPVSQLFQLDEDYQRGDETFAIHFGLPGVIYFFVICFTGGVVLTGLSLKMQELWGGGLFMILGFITGGWIYLQLRKLRAEQTDYPRIMRIKYVSSLAFASYNILLMIIDKFI